MTQNQPPTAIPETGAVIDLTLHSVQVVYLDRDTVDVMGFGTPTTRIPLVMFEAGTVTHTLATPLSWPPQAGEVWVTPLNSGNPDHTNQHTFWLAYWDSMAGPDELLLDTVTPEIRLINGHGDIRHPDELLAACRQSGTAQPERYAPAGGAR
jgi:hypothetical protein